MLDLLDALFHLDMIIRHWRATIGLVLIGAGFFVAFGLKLTWLGMAIIPIGFFFIFWEIYVYFHEHRD